MDGTPDIVAYPENRAAWGRLCRLLSTGKRRAKKGECILGVGDLLADLSGLLLIVIPPRRLEGLGTLLERLAEAAPGSVWLAATMHRRGDDRRRLARLKAIAGARGGAAPCGQRRTSTTSPAPETCRTSSPASGRR